MGVLPLFCGKYRTFEKESGRKLKDLKRVVNIDEGDIIALIEHNDIKSLRKAVFGDERPSDFIVTGDGVRTILVCAALKNNYDQPLVELALDIAAPCVDPWQLMRYIDFALPYARLYDDGVMPDTIDFCQLPLKIKRMSEDDLLDLMRSICYLDSKDIIDSLPLDVCIAMVRRVFYLSAKNCFFKSSRLTLLIYAAMIPEIDDNLEERFGVSKGPIIPPYVM